MAAGAVVAGANRPGQYSRAARRTLECDLAAPVGYITRLPHVIRIWSGLGEADAYAGPIADVVGVERRLVEESLGPFNVDVPFRSKRAGVPEQLMPISRVAAVGVDDPIRADVQT